MKKVVLKFGGSCLGTPDTATKNFDQLFQNVKRFLDDGFSPIVVVSALAGETRRLKRIASSLFNDPRDIDQIMAEGELFAVRLLKQYFTYKGLAVKDFIGVDLPIYTNLVYGSADISDVKTGLLYKALKDNIIPIVPGFIGQTDLEDIATLGFDGSDTSAVAIAAALKAEKCVLFKDVEGVFTANPKDVSEAKILEDISYEDMYIYAETGASVLHEKAVKMAWDAGLDLQVLPFFDMQSSGTLLRYNATRRDIIGLASQEESDAAYVSVVGRTAKQSMESAMAHMALSGTPLNVVQMEPHFVKYKLSNNYMLQEALQQLHAFYGLDNLNLPVHELPVQAQATLDPMLHAFKDKSSN